MASRFQWRWWCRPPPSNSRGPSRARSNARPTAGARSPGGSARIAVRGSGAARSPTRPQETRSASEPARWMTPLGCVRQCISGPAAPSPGSYYPKATGGSRHSRKAELGCEQGRANDRRETVEICRPLKILDHRQCVACHPALVPPNAHGQESYPPLSDHRSTKPWRTPLRSETPERCRRLANGPQSW
jgi:hypothetical protein